VVEERREASFVNHRGRRIQQVPTEISWSDRLGHWKARWGIRRMRYTVEPGLYAVGNPDGDSHVFVSANYKMSFDRLRRALTGMAAWILVLDSKGINVWCAAGKGTFGTDELVRRIEEVKLGEVVDHRRLVVPQLGATGVSAHIVKQRSGFGVMYGPVRAEDIPAFLDAGLKATGRMRRKSFPILERIVLVPVELVMVGRYILLAAAVVLLLAGLNRRGYSVELVMNDGPVSAVLLLATFLAAVLLGPMLLPWLPGRAFSVKGLWIGLAAFAAFSICNRGYSYMAAGWLDSIAWLLMMSAVASVVVMYFTGASTYTSLSGVRREMRIAVPLQLACAVLGLGLWLAGRFV